MGRGKWLRSNAGRKMVGGCSDVNRMKGGGQGEEIDCKRG